MTTHSNWKVRMQCVVTKLVTCEGCTREQATKKPWDHAVDELEVEQIEWTVKDVKEDSNG